MGSLNKDTLELIQQTAIASATAENMASVLELPGHEYVIVSHKDGATISEPRAEAPAPRAHVLRSLESVISFARHHGGGFSQAAAAGLLDGDIAPPPSVIVPAEAPIGKDVVVWYETAGVVVILDDSLRRDRASLPLRLHPVFADLQKIGEKRFDQKQFRRLLRIDLGKYARSNDLLQWVSSVSFSEQSGEKFKRTQTTESFGKAVRAEVVSSAGECPEELVLDVPIFDDPGLVRDKFELVCAVEILFDESRFQLIPYPGQIQLAVDRAVYIIGQRLHAALACPVFRGVP